MRASLIAALGAASVMLAAAPAAPAAEICWDALAPANGGVWSEATNWSGGVAPGAEDTAVLDTTSASCSVPASVTVAGGDVEVGRVKQGGTAAIVVDGDGTGGGLMIAGTASQAQVLGNVEVDDTGYLKIGAGATVYAGGTITLGEGGGSLLVEGALNTITDQFDVVEPSGGGSVSIAEGGSLTYGAGTSGALSAQLDNDGAIELQQAGGLAASLTIRASSGTSAQSDGVFLISPQSKLTLSPTQGSAMQISGILSGGALEIGGSVGPGGVGTVAFDDTATLDVGTLTIGPGSALDLTPAGSADQLVMALGDGRRTGAGTLTAATAQIQGGHFDDGITKVTGQATIAGGVTTPAIHDGATLLTQGATAWDTGSVTLGGAGDPGAEATWQNAGTLVIAGAPQLLAGSDNGVLKNTASGTLSRDTPAGAMVAAARIENAGSVHVLAGTMGAPDPLPAPAAEFVQTEGLTTVAAGAGLGMNVTLSGGVLRGAGTVRRIVNSGGTVEPGSSPGTLTIDGDFTQAAGGTLKLEIAGSATGQFDRLIVGEVASLGGTLAIVSAPGYAPAALTTYQIVQARARSAQFAQLTGAQAAGSSYIAQNLTDGTQLCFACGPPPGFELSVTLSGAGEGTVTSEPGGISCGTDCRRELSAGTDVTLTARPAGGSVFTGWSGVCAGLGACAVKMTQAHNITATFAPRPPEEPAAPASGSSPLRSNSTPARRISIAGIVTLPPSSGCRRSSTLSLRVRVPAGLKATRARVTVNGKAVKTVRPSALSKPVTIRRLPRGRRLRVEMTVTLADGRTAVAARLYRICRT